MCSNKQRHPAPVVSAGTNECSGQNGNYTLYLHPTILQNKIAVPLVLHEGRPQPQSTLFNVYAREENGVGAIDIFNNDNV
jgi:hypothetical protein